MTERSNNKVKTINGTAVIPDTAYPNRLKVTFPISVDLFGYDLYLFSNTGNYDVWATDYTTYSLVFSCTDYWLVHQDTAWILSREKTLDESKRKMLYDLLSNAKVDPSEFKTDIQSCDN